MTEVATTPALFNLSGPGLRVLYRSAGPELELDGDVTGLHQDQARFEADQLTVEQAEVGALIGTLVTVHLLTSRDGREIKLGLLLPAIDLADEDNEIEVSAVACVTTDFAGRSSRWRPIRCRYEVRQLEGTVARVGN